MNILKKKMLKTQLKAGMLVKVNNSEDRIDRRLMLIEIAKKNGWHIIVGSQQAFDEIKAIERYVSVMRLADGFTLDVREQAGCTLIDESLTSNMVDWIKQEQQFEIRGGFLGGN